MIADSLEEARAVCQCESMPELMEVHKKFLQKYQEKMAELAQKQASSWTQVSEETLNFLKNTKKQAILAIKKPAQEISRGSLDLCVLLQTDPDVVTRSGNNFLELRVGPNLTR